jgi:hypothetical protein
LHYPGSPQRNGSVGAHHLDFRADGGYVLLPPSLGQTKTHSRRYELLRVSTNRGRVFDWDAARQLLEPPAIAQPRGNGPSCAASVEQLAAYVGRQQEGSRNSVLYWAARSALETRATDLGPLVEAAIHAGLPEREAMRTIDSARRRDARRMPEPSTGQARTR